MLVVNSTQTIVCCHFCLNLGNLLKPAPPPPTARKPLTLLYPTLVNSTTHCRPEGEPLLTVSNHASTLDDPAVVAVLLPWDVVLRPRLMRWSVCSQEICFETPAISSFFGAGKVPLARSRVCACVLRSSCRRCVCMCAERGALATTAQSWSLSVLAQPAVE